MAEQLICNQQVDGSTPFTSSNLEDYRSGHNEAASVVTICIFVNIVIVSVKI